jgi:hypothetical protein
MTTQLIKWRATFNYQNQQMTIEFDAPQYNKNINYPHLARVNFVNALSEFGSKVTITNVEPVEMQDL